MIQTPACESYFELTKAFISIGRRRGYVLVDELNSFLPPTASSPKDLELVMNMFNRLAVGIGATEAEALEARDQIEEELLPIGAKTKEGKDGDVDIDGSEGDKFNDPVRMYLKEMGTVPLLKRENEVEIAKRIEIGVRLVMRALSRSRLASSLLIDIGKMLKENPGKIREVVGLSDEVDEDEDADSTSATQHVHHQFEKLLVYDQALQDLLDLKRAVDAGKRPSGSAARSVAKSCLPAPGSAARCAVWASTAWPSHGSLIASPITTIR